MYYVDFENGSPIAPSGDGWTRDEVSRLIADAAAYLHFVGDFATAIRGVWWAEFCVTNDEYDIRGLPKLTMEQFKLQRLGASLN